MPDSVTPWTVSCQAPLSMGFSRQEYRSGLLCPPPGDLPQTGIEPVSLKSPALAGRLSTTRAGGGLEKTSRGEDCLREESHQSRGLLWHIGSPASPELGEGQSQITCKSCSYLSRGHKPQGWEECP